MKIFSHERVDGYAENQLAREMSKKRKIVILAISILLVVALALFFLKGWVELRPLALPQEPPRVGSLAPDFELTELNGKSVRLAGFREKSPVFLNFWASWCVVPGLSPGSATE